MAGPIESLTGRERTVLPLVVEGLSNDEIGARLGVSVATANFHVRSLLRKFEVASRIELAVEAVARGHVKPTCDAAEDGRLRWVCPDGPRDDRVAEATTRVRARRKPRSGLWSSSSSKQEPSYTTKRS